MIDAARYQRWITASISTIVFHQYMPITVQGLGRIDGTIIRLDEDFLSKNTGGPICGPSDRHTGDWFTLSYLWVLGGYELARTIRQFLKNSIVVSSNEVIEQANSITEVFRRLRVPLAKFEPARPHKETDFTFPFPAVNSVYGMSWMVADGTFITRRELSDGLLEFLESLRGSSLRSNPI